MKLGTPFKNPKDMSLEKVPDSDEFNVTKYIGYSGAGRVQNMEVSTWIRAGISYYGGLGSQRPQGFR